MNMWFKDLDASEKEAKRKELYAFYRSLAGLIMMQGNTSTSESFRVALDFAIKTQTKGRVMVLFVMLVRNYDGYDGFRLNDIKYSAHPEEREVLFAEGCPVFVMGVEEVMISNLKVDGKFENPFWAKFQDKTVTVVYLLHNQ